MATAMKLSVPKPVNLPSMKKVRPRPDALTRNQRSALFFPVTNGGTRPPPEDDPRSRATVSTTAGALRERSQRAAGSERRPGGWTARNPATTRVGPRNRRRPPTRRGERSIEPAPRGRRARTRPEPRANTATVPTPPPGWVRRTRGPRTCPLLARRRTSSSETKPCPGSGASEGWTRAITRHSGDRATTGGTRRRRTRATTGTTAGTTRAGTRTSAAAAAAEPIRTDPAAAIAARL